MDWQSIVFEYVCPVGGCFLASSVFAAPINDLNDALRRGNLGTLNTRPWAVMTGNCLGWCAYSYYTSDPFVLASNLPGLILSLWLNIGACKLHYFEDIFTIRCENDCSATNPENLDYRRSTIAKNNTQANTVSATSEQEVLLFSIVSIWAIVLVYLRWLSGLFLRQGVLEPQIVVGILVNINLVFFYGAPLQTMKLVLETKSSDSIHTPTVTMNVINAVFWMSYGVARNDIIIYGPNGIGLLLGLCQVALCCIYPKRLRVAIPGSSAGGEEKAEFRPSTASTGSFT